MNNQIVYPKVFLDKFVQPIEGILTNVPENVSIEVTTRCQLKCVYCSRDMSKSEDLELSELRKIKDRLSGVKSINICGIGESFCYPYLYEALELLKDYSVSIISNGAVPIDFDRLSEIGNVNLIILSIDATSEEKMKAICGGYEFEHLLQNISRLRRKPNISGIINTTLNVYNLEEIDKIIEFAYKNRLVAVNFELPIGDEEFVMKNKEVIQKKIKRAQMLAQKNEVMLNPFYRITCNRNGYIVPNIKLNGDVYPCCNGINKDLKIGNIFEEDFQKIWEHFSADIELTKDMCHNCKLVKNMYRILY